MPLESTGNLGHLHQRKHSFLHASPAGGADNQHWIAPRRGLLNQAGEFFANDRAHRAAHEAEIHHPQGQGLAAAAADAGNHGIAQAGALLAVPDAIGVAAAVLERQWIGGCQLGIHGLKAARIGNQSDPLLAIDAVVVATALANTGVGQQILAVNHQAALGTLAPQAVVCG
jgi:hypothetical protein